MKYYFIITITEDGNKVAKYRLGFITNRCKDQWKYFEKTLTPTQKQQKHKALYLSLVLLGTF